jgi:NADP-dependent 3-hydroxy acid dehydrogenase YdfG
MTTIKNKIVFITGASAGIGKACAEVFAREGANLILNARREDKLTGLADKLENDYGAKIINLIFDVRNYDQVKEKISSLPDEWKNVDILINNAGMARGLDKLQDGTVENWDEMIDTNLKGLLYVTKEILPVMTRREHGHIINIGSIAGHDVYPGGNVYCATKFAVNGLSKAMRMDLLEKNIKVSSVDPGMVETEFSMVRFSGDEERAKNVYKGLKPLSGEDIAETVLFCASRPAHVNINEIILTPLAQAGVSTVKREA